MEVGAGTGAGGADVSSDDDALNLTPRRARRSRGVVAAVRRVKGASLSSSESWAGSSGTNARAR